MNALDLDVVIAGGQVIDGTGTSPYVADVGLRDGVIVVIGTGVREQAGANTVVIDATDRIVTPGFIDVHTHFDGQATWDELLDSVTGHGVTTSRTVGHRALDGTPVPGTFADEHELQVLGEAVAAAGGRVFEVAPAGLFRTDDPNTVTGEMAWMGRLAERTGLAVLFIMLQAHDQPERWRAEMATAARWRAGGANLVPLVAARSAAVLYGWDIRHPFTARPTYRRLAHRPLAERVARLRDPAVRATILAEDDELDSPTLVAELRFLRNVLPNCLVLSGVDPDYEQPMEGMLGAVAARTGVTVEQAAYDALLAEGALLLYPLYNYVSGDQSTIYEQLSDRGTLVSLGDGGAHCGFICDASMPTYLLTHWGRDRRRGPRFELADLVRRLTSQPAEIYGLSDRGRVAVGLRADLNVIDFDRLSLAGPVAVHDLPAGGTRLLQRATGYDATMVAGQITRRHGVDTGARPGRLLRRR